MKTRAKVGIALLFLALPVVFIGLIDPLEGGLALIAAGLIYIVAFLLIGKKPKAYLWAPFAISILIGIVTIALAISEGPGPNPSGLDISIRILLWGYRAAVVATLVGAIITAARSIKIG